MWLIQLKDILFHLPDYLAVWNSEFGPWIYVFLFLIIFAETGCVFLPFLPGDSLLFAVGAFTAVDGGLSFSKTLMCLFAAAVLGDTVNFVAGKWLGKKLIKVGPDGELESKLIRPKYMNQTRRFYEKHGGKTIVLARFFPIFRTYAPFVAGICSMDYLQFVFFNTFGGFVWISSLLLCGYFFGNIPEVQSHFHYVIVAILLISILPAIVEMLRSRKSHVAEDASV